MDHNDLDCREYHTSIDMLKLWYDTFTDMFGFFFVLGYVSGEGIQNGNAAPFRAFVEGNQKLVENRARDVEDGSIIGWHCGIRRGGIVDICESRDGVSDYLQFKERAR
jgi:hypothetical protein